MRVAGTVRFMERVVNFGGIIGCKGKDQVAHNPAELITCSLPRRLNEIGLERQIENLKSIDPPQTYTRMQSVHRKVSGGSPADDTFFSGSMFMK